MRSRVTDKPVVYVAGPFRGASHWEQEQNIRKAEEIALRIWQYGAIAYCPHCNTRNFQGAAPDEIWLEGHLEMLRRSDALFLCPNWKKSKGTLIEYQKANEWHMPIFNSITQLHEWLQELHRMKKK